MRGDILLPIILVAACSDKADRISPDNVAVATVASTPIANAPEVAGLPRRSPPRASAPKPTPLQDRSARADYRAIGTEPFWAVTLRESSLVLERPDKPSLHVAVTRSDEMKAIRYLGQGFAMTISEGPCNDGMSDAIWSDSVQIAFGEGTLKGCGGTREVQDHAP